MDQARKDAILALIKSVQNKSNTSDDVIKQKLADEFNKIARSIVKEGTEDLNDQGTIVNSLQSFLSSCFESGIQAEQGNEEGTFYVTIQKENSIYKMVFSLVEPQPSYIETLLYRDKEHVQLEESKQGKFNTFARMLLKGFKDYQAGHNQESWCERLPKYLSSI